LEARAEEMGRSMDTSLCWKRVWRREGGPARPRFVGSEAGGGGEVRQVLGGMWKSPLPMKWGRSWCEGPAGVGRDGDVRGGAGDVLRKSGNTSLRWK